MLIRRQDVGVLLLHYLGYSRIRHIVLRLQRRPVTTFVTFHDLPPEALGRFKEKLQFLKRSTNVVSLNDFFHGRLTSNKINVAITFDDGYKSWVSYAVPVLRELKLPAIFFISSGFIGLSKDSEAEFVRSKLLLTMGNRRTTGLNFEDVRRIVSEGFTVGGHTSNHSNLAVLRDGIQLRREIIEDKIRLESITGREIEYFAYPSGAYQNQVLDVAGVLKEAGYKGAVTTVSGFNSLGTNPYLLHRELTGASMPLAVFKARVYGNYEAVQFVKRIF
jgi:peptidoglycan/xylan/chitin deacetylase (PgdA/CDA1 family)